MTARSVATREAKEPTMTTQHAPARPIPTVAIRTAYGPATMPCEVVSGDFVVNPAMATDPETGAATLGGGFTVTHLHSGYAMPGPQVCIDCARAAARALSSIVGVDWTTLDLADHRAFMDSLRADTKVEIRNALAILCSCGQEMCPPPDISIPADSPDDL
jgi:hypothetical protein